MLRKFSCKTLVLAVCLVCMGALTSCIDDTFGKWLGLGDGVKITYTIDGMTDENGNKAPASRGFTDDDGNEMLRSAHFIFFKEDGQYLCTKMAEGTAENGQIAITDLDGISDNQKYKTLIIGNAAEFVPPGHSNNFIDYVESIKGNDGEIADYDDMKRRLLVAGNPSKTLQPLVGRWVDGAGHPGDFVIVTSDGGERIISGSVRFSRSVCRINFTNNADDLIITRMTVCNAALATPVFYAEGVGSEASTSQYRHSTVVDIKESDWIEMPEGGVKGSELINTIYLFPNFAATPTRADRITTCLLIEARYNGSDKVSYYRYNICNKNQTQYLRPNHSYNVVITGVSGAGQSTPTNAWLMEDLLLYTVKTGDMHENGVVEIDGFDERPIKCGYYNPNTNDLPVSTANGITKYPIAIDVSVIDPTQYTIDVQTDFKAIDAELSTDPVSVVNNSGKLIDILTGGKTIATVYLQIHRTGPDDAPIESNITIIARKDGIIRDSRSIPVKITSNCKHGDVIFKRAKFDAIHSSYVPTGYEYVVIADRNSEVPRYNADGTSNKIPRGYVDPTSRTSSEEKGAYGKIRNCFCGNESYIPSVYKWLTGSRYYQSEKDPDWYSTNLTAWRKTLPAWSRNAPSKYWGENWHRRFLAYTVLDANIIQSKGDLFIISDFKSDGKYVGSWIPETHQHLLCQGNFSLSATCYHGQYNYTTQYLYDEFWNQYGSAICINNNYMVTYWVPTEACFAWQGYFEKGTNNNNIYPHYTFVGPNRHWRPLTAAELTAAQSKIGTLTDW